MPIYNLFSKKQKALRGEIPDVYTHDKIPLKLKVQIIHIIKDAIGYNLQPNYSEECDGVYQLIFDTLCREYGKFSLAEGRTPFQQLINFFEKSQDLEENLDFIQLTFQIIQNVIGENFNYYKHRQTNAKLHAIDAIEELNQRFKENGIGFQFEGNEIVKVDSTYIHSEITKPVISLLWNKKFLGANEEYLKAHEHYKNGRNKECLTECLKAFESILKIICKEKNWKFNQTDTSKRLIEICFQNELVPSFTQNQFTSLQNLLISGIPTIRNKVGGHGQGQIPQKVDDEITRYCLNLTGTNIIFLIEQSGIK